jgi:DNA-binding NarL/FixJ family response regulator
MQEPENAANGEVVAVLIVDDHEVVALGLEALLNDDPLVEVVGCVRTVTEAIAANETLKPNVVLMDYRLPDGTGAQATRKIRANDNPPAVVMVTSSVDRHVLAQALDAGCCGFVSKHADRRDLVDAIRAAAAGDAYFTRDMLTHLVHLRRFDEVEGIELTAREIEVLQATAEGLSPEAIAGRLFLSPHTVKNHLRHAMAKLDSHTKLEAVVKAIRSRLISADA